jgi:hypothetical protein
VNSRKQIEMLDFWAFILGILAGFSFLSRISKFVCEKFKICDQSREDYVEFKEDSIDKKSDKPDQLEKNHSDSKLSPKLLHQNSVVELEFKSISSGPRKT